MKASSERYPVTDRNGSTVGNHEDGTLTVDGRKFDNSGAHVDPERAAGYPQFDREFIGADGMMNDWHGAPIGTCRIVALWRVNSWMGSWMYQIEATIDGRTYTGRGMGSGMLWRGKTKR